MISGTKKRFLFRSLSGTRKSRRSSSNGGRPVATLSVSSMTDMLTECSFSCRCLSVSVLYSCPLLRCATFPEFNGHVPIDPIADARTLSFVDARKECVSLTHSLSLFSPSLIPNPCGGAKRLEESNRPPSSGPSLPSSSSIRAGGSLAAVEG